MKTLIDEATDILVFKTNITHPHDVSRITPYFLAEPRIRKWHVDTENISKVLRIEAEQLSVPEIIRLVEHSGYSCEELTD